ncbi:zinc metalloprotease [Candidatus Promineifilum breve]|nr:hypothetical protein [Candidatus Promineifilum breve]
MTSLFNVLALVYIVRAIQLAVQIGRNWGALRQEPLTGAKQRQAEQAAFFLGVPPAVLVHEAAHALAVVAFGGRVVEFGYRVFWGYVVPDGVFSAAENWLIAIAGTLGSLAFGTAVWLVARRSPSRTIRYFGLRAVRFQIYFSLLYYPLFSLFLPIGDWRSIYDFGATPILSAATAVAHALALLWFWRADRVGTFEMVAFESAAAQSRFERAGNSLGDPMVQLQAIAALQVGGAPHQARTALDIFLSDYPQSAEGHLQKALLRGGRGQVDPDAARSAERALALGLRQPDDAALARRLVARHYLERGDGRAAVAALDPALAAAEIDPAGLSPGHLAELRYMRAQGYRRLGQYEAARADIAAAQQTAAELGHEPLLRRYAEEAQLINAHDRDHGRDHAGRDLSPPVSEGNTTNHSSDA